MKEIANTLQRLSRAGMLPASVKAICMTACLVLPWQAVMGQEPQAEPETPRFTVEIIVFTYSDGNSAGNEIFVPDKPKLVPDTDETEQPVGSERVFSDIPLEGSEPLPALDDPAGSEDEESPERERIELRVLDPDEHSMSNLHATLERLDAYDPILHTAWTQSTLPREVSPAIQLRALGDLPPGLDGTLSLYLGRYLHLVVDLALDAEPRQQSMSATDRLVRYGAEGLYGEGGGADDSFGGIRDRAVRYRIVEDRIMRTGDLRYFDHPRFGVIAKVTRPAGDSTDNGSTPSTTNP